jgi:hypothetical protein
MEKFAFVVHPITASDVSRKFPFTKNWSDGFVESLIKLSRLLRFPSSKIVSSPYNESEGWFVGCPLTSRRWSRCLRSM